MKRYDIRYATSEDGINWDLHISPGDTRHHAKAKLVAIKIEFFYAKDEVANMRAFSVKLYGFAKKLLECALKEGITPYPQGVSRYRTWNTGTNYAGEIAVIVALKNEEPDAVARKLKMAADNCIAALDLK